MLIKVTGAVSFLLVSFIFLFQLKLDSLTGHYFFVDFDRLSCVM